ncbi:MAG TPA: PASTA domain-containing protein [Candidatus Dormibacteraeota bacterium]|nr:PASTA domain-containing protein [Candidatus Dormibacteraeota bacterium]
MNLRERFRWVLRMSMLAFILASVAFLSALTAMRIAIRGREVVMPDLAGVSVDQARQMLQGRGVGVTIEDRIYSHYPVDDIVRQSPLPNMNVKVGQRAHVVLSLGPQKVTVPQLEDSSLRAAQVQLLREGLQVGEVSSLYLPYTDADTVLQQDPAPGSTGAINPHVNVLVTLGPRPPAYVMPALTGLSFAEAAAKLSAAGLKIAKVVPANSPGAAKQTVLDQTPARGRRVDDTTPIDLQVAE